jgi:hypothetical protein
MMTPDRWSVIGGVSGSIAAVLAGAGFAYQLVRDRALEKPQLSVVARRFEGQPALWYTVISLSRRAPQPAWRVLELRAPPGIGILQHTHGTALDLSSRPTSSLQFEWYLGPEGSPVSLSIPVRFYLVGLAGRLARARLRITIERENGERCVLRPGVKVRKGIVPLPGL